MPPRWIIVAAIGGSGAVLLVAGFISGAGWLVGIGIGLALGGLLVALGADLLSFNLGFLTVQLPIKDTKASDGERPRMNNLFDQSVTVLQRRSDQRIFFEAPNFVQSELGGRRLTEADEPEVTSLVSRTVEQSRPEPLADWILAPGSEVAQSGIYDVVDEHGRYLNYQRAVTTSADGDSRFPEPNDTRAAGYILRKAPVHQTERGDIHAPGQVVPWDGIYDVVDKHGHYLGRQKVCVKGMAFTPLKRAADPAAAGYLLRDRAVDRGGL